MTGLQGVPDRAIDATPSAVDVRDLTGPNKQLSEHDLYAQVLNQAILDLNGPSERDKEESIRLLTETHGDIARHRDWLCVNAGLDPVAFFERVAPIARQAAVTPIKKRTPGKHRKKGIFQ